MSDDLPPRPPRHEPNLWTIASYWEARDMFYVDLEEPHCFGCYKPRMRPQSRPSARWNYSGLERAHLVDRVLGGLDGPQNIVPLCWPCHKAMPSFGEEDGQAAIAWVQAGARLPDLWAKVIGILSVALQGKIDADRAIKRLSDVSLIDAETITGMLERGGFFQEEIPQDTSWLESWKQLWPRAS